MSLDLLTSTPPIPTAENGSSKWKSSHSPRALFVLEAEAFELIYGLEERRTLERLADFYAPAQTRESVSLNPAILANAEIIFSGWGAPKMDAQFLKAAPNLRAVFYGAGTVGYFTSDTFWDRRIRVTSAYAANGQAVAEYTLSMIFLSLKKFWQFSAEAKLGLGWGDHTREVPGGFEAKISLIGCGMIARRLISILKQFDVHCFVYDPFITEEEAAELGVQLCTLDEAFMYGDVVSLHAADKPETHGLISGRHLALMKPGATFINTARGRIVRETELVDVLRERCDLTAILDVCFPEPPPVGSPLLSLPNIILTPHIAGSLGKECRRMGRYMVDEFKRYLRGEPLRWEITREMAAKLA